MITDVQMKQILDYATADKEVTLLLPEIKNILNEIEFWRGFKKESEEIENRYLTMISRHKENFYKLQRVHKEAIKRWEQMDMEDDACNVTEEIIAMMKSETALYYPVIPKQVDEAIRKMSWMGKGALLDLRLMGQEGEEEWEQASRIILEYARENTGNKINYFRAILDGYKVEDSNDNSR